MPITISKPSYRVADKDYQGFLADGAGGGPAPGILVVHEGRGYTQHAQDRAVMLAELGYVAYAPDYFGAAATSLEHAYEIMRPFAEDRSRFREHGLRALDTLLASPSVDPHRLGAIGFCWGGYAVLELACHSPLRAVVGFHPGLSLGPLSDAAAMTAKVLISVGDNDPYVPMSDIESFMAEMNAAAVDCQVQLLLGAPHSFSNPEPYPYETGTANVGYDPVADRRAWTAMRNLFDETF